MENDDAPKRATRAKNEWRADMGGLGMDRDEEHHRRSMNGREIPQQTCATPRPSMPAVQALAKS
jgi:hypothetical protein